MLKYDQRCLQWVFSMYSISTVREIPFDWCVVRYVTPTLQGTWIEPPQAQFGNFQCATEAAKGETT